MNDNFKKKGEDNFILNHQALEIINFLPDATFIINNSREVIAWNKAMEELTGVSASEILGKNNYDYSLPFYNDRRPILIDLALETKETLEKSYHYFLRNKDTLTAEVYVPKLKNGVYLWAKARPLYDNSGNVIGAIESVRDITERRLIEMKLQESLNRLNCLHRIIKLLKHPSISIDEILQGTLEQIQCASNFPEKLCARIIFNSKIYTLGDYKKTAWSFSHKTIINDKDLLIEVNYFEEKPFIKEEEKMIKDVAEEIKNVFEDKLGYI